MSAGAAPRFAFKGLMAPTFAPFDDDGSLNLGVIPRYAQLLHDGGVTGVYINGTMGEGVSMTTSERKQLAEAWLRWKDMVGAVVVQVGGCSCADSKELARHAVSLGASAIACLPPLYYKPSTVQDLIYYCKEVAAAVPDTPFLYYHIPSMTGVNFPMDEFLDAAAPVIPTLAGLKFTSFDVESEGVKCLKAAGGAMTILTGFPQSLSKSRKLGFPGAINGGFNFMPLEAGRLFCLAGLEDEDPSSCCNFEGDRAQEVQRLQERLNAPWDVIAKHCEGSTVSAAKLAMSLLTGLPVGPARCPQRPLSPAAVAALKADLTSAGFAVLERE